MQQATVLYNDRINTWRRMKQLDEELEKNPTEKMVAQMAELRLRNLQCFAELQSYNDTGRYLCRHPLLSGRSEFARLTELLRRDVPEFLRQHKNVLDNIKRYKSYLKRKDRRDRRQQDRERLHHFEESDRMFRMVLEELRVKSYE